MSGKRGLDFVCISKLFEEVDVDVRNFLFGKELMGGDGFIKYMKKGDGYYYGKVMKELRFYGYYRWLERDEEYGGFWFL